MSDIQDRLNECRRRTGDSYRDLENKTGYSFSHMRDVHAGRRTATSDILQALAIVYRTTVEYLRDGNPVVGIWPEFRVLPWVEELGDVTVSRGQRVAAAMQYMAQRYPGHLLIADLPKYLPGVSFDVISQVASTGAEPTGAFVRAISQLSGIDVEWFQMGDTTKFIDAAIADGLTTEEVHKLILIGAKAKRAGVAFDDLDQMISIFAKTKGGG